ncbi:sporulation lipoprotein YhcN/YlaJ [Anoxybacillus vitaminiphilus]|uniref:Sporulation lipoprotein YhcN/YlaJ n=1 Tax=Paranoxybacillus vitaminiphilus TaxID=581036 RepID=A0A327Y3M3_9BACL|nr:YhcN/YlaJ family sporulation lipoprotein [Anoxybacillus vitaminiphilus]RAK15344.1 sporulation lipoprotein YhcN/YlaJ [Anoxybacillus vitaminiphilus]
MLKKLFLVLFIFSILFGCAKEKENQQQSLQNFNITRTSTKETADAHLNQTAAKQAVQRISQKREVKDVVAVNTKKKLLLAYQVKHLQRFRMKQIEKEVKEELENLFPDYDVIISSDMKLFWKTEELKRKLSKDGINEKEVNKQIKKLEKLSNELT